VSITKEGAKDSLLYGLPPRLVVFQWHGDTFEVPQGGTLLARGVSCKNQAFRVGHYAYGLQFHIEASPDMVREWIKGQEGRVNVRKIEKGSIANGCLVESQATMILSNFQRIIESSLRFRSIIKQYIDDRAWAEKKAISWWEMS
jgi:hypothetical protein